jgi:hypothetical protein
MTATRNARAAMMLSSVLLLLSLAPAALGSAAQKGTTAPTSSANVDLSGALSDDGTFVGGQGINGSVDMKKWRLASDLNAAEPPRFEPATAPGAITPGAWSALGCCWDGNAASASLVSHVYVITVSGTDVYVGGNFFDAGGVPAADYIAKWNGSVWSALAADQNAATGPINNRVDAITVSGSNVYVGGLFLNAASDTAADYLAVWNGSSWSDIAGLAPGANPQIPANEVYAIAINGSNVYVGGFWVNAGGISNYDHVLRWDGSWHALGQTNTLDGPIQATVRALVATADGVIAGGDFTNVGGEPAIDYIAEFNVANFTWSGLGSNSLNGPVRALRQSGTDIYVGGDFLNAGGDANADYVAIWHTSGSTWSALGPGPLNAHVYAIALSGSNVYVGGHFLDAGGFQTADRVARWNGSVWAPLGSNGFNDGPLNWNAGDPAVYALATTTNALYAGGTFQDGGGIGLADYVAAYGIGAVTNQKPDGRIKKGSGTLVGNNIYNTTGVNQTRTGSAAVGSTITFTISIQNDGSNAGKFKVAATASGNVNYEVKYFRGTTNITSAVVAGTYLTGSVGVGNAFAIKAKVKVLPAAIAGSSTTRLVTITSNADATKIDAVKLIGKRS